MTDPLTQRMTVLNAEPECEAGQIIKDWFLADLKTETLPKPWIERSQPEEQL